MIYEYIDLVDDKSLIHNDYDAVVKNTSQSEDEVEGGDEKFLAPSSARFIVAILIFMTSFLNGFIQCSFVTIW